MDKTSSFRCVKFSLVAGNSAVIVMGICGFIIGLIDPPFMQLNDIYSATNYPMDYGPQLALVSCIAVVIATAGLIGALREHFYLLLVYALCIMGVFIFRITWWATSQLHQEKRFILDLTVSVTLLTFLAKFFLLIFAILEALTIQNSLPLTKQKFLMLRSKLQSKTKSNETTKNGPPKEKPRSKGKAPPADNIYITSSSIYGSGRRRSPVRMNGHHTGHHNGHHVGHHNNSSRARKYLPGVGLNPSPDGSDSSHDSNNNKNISVATQNASLNKSDSPLVIDTLDQHRVPKNLSSDHYYRFQSPSPSTPTSVKESLSKLTNQPYQVYPRGSSLQRLTPTLTEPRSATSKSATLTSPNITSRVTSPPTHRSSSPLSPPSTLLTTTTTTRHISSPPVNNSHSSYIEITPNYPRPTTLTNSKWSTPTPVPKPLSSTPTTSASSITTSSRDYQTQRANFFTSPPTSYNSSNLFNYSSLGTLKSTAPLHSSNTLTTSTTSSNLNQTRNLFSMYTSPLTTTTTVTNPTPSVTSPSFLSSPYRSTLPSKTVTSPLPAPRVTRTPLQMSSSSPTSHSQSTNYLQLSLGPTNTTTTVSNTPSHYSRLAGPSTAMPKTTSTTTSSSSTGNLFSRSNPKHYQDYVKSYRYPAEQSTAQPRTRSPISPPQVRTISDRTSEAFSSMKRSGSLGTDLETTTTYMSTTTQHRQLTERESVYYRETLREG